MSADEARQRAVGVIRTDLAGVRRDRYELNMGGLARRNRFDMVEIVRISAETRWPTVELLGAVRRLEAVAIIAPSVAHVPTPRVVTEFVDLYVVGRGRIYRRGHRWPSSR